MAVSVHKELQVLCSACSGFSTGTTYVNISVESVNDTIYESTASILRSKSGGNAAKPWVKSQDAAPRDPLTLITLTT